MEDCLPTFSLGLDKSVQVDITRLFKLLLESVKLRLDHLENSVGDIDLASNVMLARWADMQRQWTDQVLPTKNALAWIFIKQINLDNKYAAFKQELPFFDATQVRSSYLVLMKDAKQRSDDMTPQRGVAISDYLSKTIPQSQTRAGGAEGSSFELLPEGLPVATCEDATAAWLFDLLNVADNKVQVGEILERFSPMSWHIVPKSHAVFSMFKSEAPADQNIRTALALVEQQTRVMVCYAKAVVSVVKEPLENPGKVFPQAESWATEARLSGFGELNAALASINEIAAPSVTMAIQHVNSEVADIKDRLLPYLQKHPGG